MIGYDGINFVRQAKGIGYNQIAIAGNSLFMMILVKLAIKYSKFGFVRRIATYIPDDDLKENLLKVFKMDCVGLFVNISLSIVQLVKKEQDIDYKGGDYFSFVMAFISIVLVISVLWLEYRHIRDLNVSFNHDGLGNENKWQAYFNILFIVRRAVFVIILVCFEDFAGL
jgi:hypothetical protein